MTFFKKIVRRVVEAFFCYPNALIRRTAWWRGLFVDYGHTRYPDNVWYREHDERNYACVNLGSSAAYWCFDYTGTGVRGMNWANVPQTLLDDFRLLKNFHSILRQGGKIFIVIMPFTGLNKRTGWMDTFKYLGTLDYTLLDTTWRSKACHFYAMPIFFGRSALRAVIRYLLKKERTAGLPTGANQEENLMEPQALEADAERWVAGWQAQFGIQDLKAPLTPENLEGRAVRVKVMREMVDFARERGYEPIYVIPPMTAPLANRLTPVFWEQYVASFLREVDRDVRTLDYLRQPKWQDASLFFNSFFMNAKGRRLFTKQVLMDCGLCPLADGVP